MSLKENIGASYLMNATIHDWALEILGSFAEIDPNRLEDPIEANPNQPAEIVDIGGGAIILLFRKSFDAVRVKFNRALSQKIISEAPGLPITFHEVTYVWSDNPDDEGVAMAHHRLLDEIKQGRGQQLHYHGQFGLGVTAVCQSTSLPAVTIEYYPNEDEPPTLLSAEAYAKRQIASNANDKIQGELIFDTQRYAFPLDFDDLGRSKDDTSLVGVISTDGDQLGALIEHINTQFPQVRHNRDFINRLRNVSKTLAHVNRQAQQAMLDSLQSAVVSHTDQPQILNPTGQADITFKEDDKNPQTYFLPFRPLEAGGDDMIFVCDGRIAIDLAITYLKAFESYAQQELCPLLNVDNLSASAGIAIVATHYPFARAYKLSKELLKSAKTLSREQTTIDWHFTTGGLYGDVDAIRKREYTVNEGSLTLRPLLLNTDDVRKTPNSWQLVESLTTNFQSGDWRDSRNKAKGLMSALRLGRAETIRYRKRYLSGDGDPKLPKVPYEQNGKKKSTTSGWIDGQCVYFDALELMDLYVPLAKREEIADG